MASAICLRGGDDTSRRQSSWYVASLITFAPASVDAPWFSMLPSRRPSTTANRCANSSVPWYGFIMLNAACSPVECSDGPCTHGCVALRPGQNSGAVQPHGSRVWPPRSRRCSHHS